MEYQSIHLASIDSTNTFAKKNLENFDKAAITVISASEQTGGKGRFDRSWHSPKDKNLYSTFVFFLNKNADLTTLGQLLSISIAKLLQNYGLNPKLKWPNDIFVHEKKIAGILSELVFGTNKVACIVGVGLNVNMENWDDSQISQKATSIYLETKKKISIEKVRKDLCMIFQQDLCDFIEKGFAYFHPTYDTLLLYKGKKVTFCIGDKKIIGVLHSTTVEGKINLYYDQKIHTFNSGVLKISNPD